jgi:CheY-like chemotaxis protein
VVILLVDDEPSILEMTASILKELGCEVICATDPREALAKLADDPRIEGLVTDVQMPGMDGYSLVDKAKQIRNGLRVLLMSGRDPGRRGTPVLRKPFSQKDLARRLAQTIGRC